MKVYYIDLTGVSSKVDFHDAIEKSLPVPSWYGRNLDALHDILEEYGEDWKVIFYNCKDADAAIGDYMTKMRRMCAHVSDEYDCRILPGIGSEQIRFYQ